MEISKWTTIDEWTKSMIWNGMNHVYFTSWSKTPLSPIPTNNKQLKSENKTPHKNLRNKTTNKNDTTELKKKITKRFYVGAYIKVKPLCWLWAGMAATARHTARHSARAASSCADAQRVASAWTPLSSPLPLPLPPPLPPVRPGRGLSPLDRIRCTLTSRKFCSEPIVSTNKICVFVLYLQSY